MFGIRKSGESSQSVRAALAEEFWKPSKRKDGKELDLCFGIAVRRLHENGSGIGNETRRIKWKSSDRDLEETAREGMSPQT